MSYRPAPLLLLLTTLLVGCEKNEVADTVLYNGVIYTADSQHTMASAVAIRNDLLLYVGSNEGALKYAGPDTVREDLDGRLVLPGLHDSHIHPTSALHYNDCNLQSQPLNLSEISLFIRNCIERLAIPDGEWVNVKQWNFSAGNQPAEGLVNLRQTLDRASTSHPIMLWGNDGHHNATNSNGLQRAHTLEDHAVPLDAGSLNSEYAEFRPYIGVDAQGELNGTVDEIVPELLGTPWSLNIDTQLKAEIIADMPRQLNSKGITSLMEAAYQPALEPLYMALAETPLRITLASFFNPRFYQTGDHAVDYPRIMREASAIRRRFADISNIKADTLKFFVDGVLEGNPRSNPPALPNAAVLHAYQQPRFAVDPIDGELQLINYVDTDSEVCRTANNAEAAAFRQFNGFHPAQCQQSYGVYDSSRETTTAFTRQATQHDFYVHFHTIGDRAVSTALDAIEQMDETGSGNFSLTHVQLAADDDIARIGKLQLLVSLTFAWAIRDADYDMTVIPFIDKLSSPSAMYEAHNYYYRNAYPARAIRDAGGLLAGGSDAPVDTDDPRPFINMAAAITRDLGEGPLNPDQAISIYDAIDAYTINGAKMLHQAQLTGSLEAGKKADLIVLDRDIIALAESDRAAEIADTQVLQTWFDGNRVYARAE